MSEILIGSYTEKGYNPIPAVRLSEEDYALGLQCFVPACTDIVVVDPKRKTVYLTRRSIKPMMGWWWIGGKMNPDDVKEISAIRSLKRETGIDISADRFNLIAVLDCRWKDREQVPQDIGCHVLAYVFSVGLEEGEISQIELDETFEKGIGLVPFTRKEIEQKIVEGEAITAILDVYNHIFPA